MGIWIMKWQGEKFAGWQAVDGQEPSEDDIDFDKCIITAGGLVLGLSGSEHDFGQYSESWPLAQRL